MGRISGFAVVAALVAVLCGCESPRLLLDAEARAGNRALALIDVPEPGQHILLNFSPAVPLLGFIPAIAMGAEQDRRTAEFTRLIKDQSLDLGPALAGALQRALEARGMEVERLEGVRPGVRDETYVDYSNIKTTAPAILEVFFIGAGYFSPVSAADYRPWLRVVARMVSSTPPYKLMYLQILNFGPPLAGGDTVINLPAPEGQYAYPGYESLMADPRGAADGILSGVQPVAGRIAEQLAPEPVEELQPAPGRRSGRGTTLDDLKDLLRKD